MKKGKEWARKEERGSMRWERDGTSLAIQWKDSRPVTMLTTIDSANEYVMVKRKIKSNSTWSTKDIKQPKVIDRYNKNMNAVDRSDQMLAKNNGLRKCVRWWKTLFFHMIDIAVVNGYILFQIHRASNPGEEALKRPQKLSVTEFREELIRNLAGLDEFGNPPTRRVTAVCEPGQFETLHMPQFSATKRNCKVCYASSKKELKVFSFCSAPQCQFYLHCTADKNCFQIWHSDDYAFRK